MGGLNTVPRPSDVPANYQLPQLTVSERVQVYRDLRKKEEEEEKTLGTKFTPDPHNLPGVLPGPDSDFCRKLCHSLTEALKERDLGTSLVIPEINFSDLVGYLGNGYPIDSRICPCLGELQGFLKPGLVYRLSGHGSHSGRDVYEGKVIEFSRKTLRHSKL